jgi:hypothetical protein
MVERDAEMPVSAEPRSRRALLGAGVGALVATAANALGRASPVGANDENIQVGHTYTTATTETKLKNHANGNSVFIAETTDPGGTGLVGIGGATGVAGSSANGLGVYAEGAHGEGFML